MKRALKIVVAVGRRRGGRGRLCGGARQARRAEARRPPRAGRRIPAERPLHRRTRRPGALAAADRIADAAHRSHRQGQGRGRTGRGHGARRRERQAGPGAGAHRPHRSAGAKVAAREADVAAAKAQLVWAEKNRNQQKALLEKSFISQSAFDNIQSNYDVAVAKLHAAEAELVVARKSLGDAVLVAPFSGIVSLRHAQPGRARRARRQGGQHRRPVAPAAGGLGAAGGDRPGESRPDDEFPRRGLRRARVRRPHRAHQPGRHRRLALDQRLCGDRQPRRPAARRHVRAGRADAVARRQRAGGAGLRGARGDRPDLRLCNRGRRGEAQEREGRRARRRRAGAGARRPRRGRPHRAREPRVIERRRGRQALGPAAFRNSQRSNPVPPCGSPGSASPIRSSRP